MVSETGSAGITVVDTVSRSGLASRVMRRYLLRRALLAPLLLLGVLTLTFLLDKTGNPLAPAYYWTAALVFGLIAMVAVKESSPAKRRS